MGGGRTVHVTSTGTTGERDTAGLAAAVQRRERGETEAALVLLDALAGADPGWSAPRREAGRCLALLGLDTPALQALAQAVALEPGDAQSHYHLGVQQRKLDDCAGALASFERASALDAGFANAWYRLGNLCFEAGNPELALDRYDHAIACDDRLAAFHFNRGVVLKVLGRELDAIEAYARALERDPRHLDARFNRANTLAGLGRLDEALAGFGEALAQQPDHAPSQFNRALALLAKGDLVAGFAGYAWRWRVPGAAPAPREFTQRRWTGVEPLSGKALLVHAEQGLGDFIQFSRYARTLRERGATVLLETPSTLLGLIQSLDGPSQCLAVGAALPAFDYHCSVMDLAGALGTRLDTVPASTGYLRAPPAHLGRWQATLGLARQPRIGLVWSGASAHRNDVARSIAVEQLAPLSRLPFEFHCLQQEVRERDATALACWPGLVRHAAGLRDFSDTAALASLMDLVIAVDTSVAHLAGALGRPVWVLLPRVPDWRWLLDRPDSPWYPTMRLFRQSTVGDWPGVVAALVQALRASPPDMSRNLPLT